ncbi:hypothetical protein CspHIS471_0202420 [Cutaneotrichosporon sp. HIS471]|nr:hypothetical protein CspHIS471_0202420 [Cutaneotrichosporon sp. HIS471]
MTLPLRLDARAHAHAPGRPSPLRERFDATDIQEEIRITLKFKVPLPPPPPLPEDTPSPPSSPGIGFPSSSPDDGRKSPKRTSLRLSPPAQVFTYTPYQPEDKAHLATKNDIIETRASSRGGTNAHLTARLQTLEARRVELQRSISETETLRTGYIVDIIADKQNGNGGEEAEELTRLCDWSDDDLAYDRHALAELEERIRQWERYVDQVAQGDVCSRPRSLCKKRPREEDEEGKVSRPKVNSGCGRRDMDNLD